MNQTSRCKRCTNIYASCKYGHSDCFHRFKPDVLSEVEYNKLVLCIVLHGQFQLLKVLRNEYKEQLVCFKMQPQYQEQLILLWCRGSRCQKQEILTNKILTIREITTWCLEQEEKEYLNFCMLYLEQEEDMNLINRVKRFMQLNQSSPTETSTLFLYDIEDDEDEEQKMNEENNPSDVSRVDTPTIIEEMLTQSSTEMIHIQGDTTNINRIQQYMQVLQEQLKVQTLQLEHLFYQHKRLWMWVGGALAVSFSSFLYTFAKRR